MKPRHSELASLASDDIYAKASGRNSKPKEARSVQVDEDMVWQRRTWTIQRLGWLAMGGLVLTALTGVFGYGPVSWQQATDPTSLVRVEYERFQRQGSEFTLRVDVVPQAIADNVVPLRVSGSFLDAFEVKGIAPEPREARSLGADIEYMIPVAQSGQAATIRFALKLREVGSHSAEIGLSGREPARFTQFVYP